MNCDRDYIAAAIAALPYRKPRPDFRARVLAAAAGRPAARKARAAGLLAGFCAGIVALGAGILAAAGIWLAARNSAGILAALAEPAGLAAGFRFLVLKAWLAGAGCMRLAGLAAAALPLAAPSAALLAKTAGAALLAAGLAAGIAGRPGAAPVK